MKFVSPVFIVIVLAAELFASSFVQAQGTLYVSNLGQTSTSSASIGSDSWIGQQIYTGTNTDGYDLNSVQLLMDAASGSPSGFTVSIYSDSSDEPGSSLGSLSGSDPSAGGIFTYTASGITLSPATDYFIVLTAATPVAQGAYVWSAANSSQGSDLWAIDNAYYSSSDGSSWMAYAPRGGGDAPQMAIYATAVPEPSTLALAGLGLACLSFWLRR